MTERWKDGQAQIHRTHPVTTGGRKKEVKKNVLSIGNR